MNIVELGHAAPHDHVTRRRVAGAVEIAAESGDLYDVIGDGGHSMGFPRLGFDQLHQ